MKDCLGALMDQWGGVAPRQELLGSVTRGALNHAAVTGRLIRLAPGIYADPRADPGRTEFRRRLGLAVGGPDSVLSHGTAAAVWSLRQATSEEPVHVTVPRGRTARSRCGVVLHQAATLDPVELGGWPLTSVQQTLVGLAGQPEHNHFRFPALAATQRGLISPAEMGDTAGVPRTSLGLWNRVAEEASAGAESGGEGLYWRLIRESSLPDPELNRWLTTHGRRYRVDAIWPRYQMATEIDGREHHIREADFERDRMRQNQIHSNGVVIVWFTVSQVLRDPQGVVQSTEENLRARAYQLGEPVVWG